MKLNVNIKSFFVGALFMLICMTALMHVYAAVGKGVKSAEYNNTRIIFNDKEIDIKSHPMVTVVKEDEKYGSNYMPVRKVLNEMGYGVAWAGSSESILVFTEEFLQQSEEWVDFDDVLNTINEIADEERKQDVANRISFNEERQAVHIYFDAKHEWSICTAVIGDKVYVERAGINNFYNLYKIPFILTPDEIAFMEMKKKEYEKNPDAFVRTRVISEIVNIDESEYSVALFIGAEFAPYDDAVLEFSNGIETLGTVEIYTVEQLSYVRKADVNPYLVKCGYEPIK